MVPFLVLLAAFAPPMPGMPSQPQQMMTPMPLSTPLSAPSPFATAAAPALTDAQATARAKEWLARLQTGNIDRTQLTSTMSSALTPSVVANVRSHYAPLGSPTSFTLIGKQSLTNGDTEYEYRVVFKQTTVTEKLIVSMSGTIDGLLLNPGG